MHEYKVNACKQIKQKPPDNEQLILANVIAKLYG